MNKITIVAVAALTLAATAAQADQRYRHQEPMRHRGGWAAPLIGGLIIGGIVGGLAYGSHRGPECPYGTQPGRVPAYDEYGRFIGHRKACLDY